MKEEHNTRYKIRDMSNSIYGIRVCESKTVDRIVITGLADTTLSKASTPCR